MKWVLLVVLIVTYIFLFSLGKIASMEDDYADNKREENQDE